MAGGSSYPTDSLSYYYQTMEEAPQARYRQKLAMLGKMQDPYFTINHASSMDWQAWPSVEYPDYFIARPSSYTKQELKAYKSLEG